MNEFNIPNHVIASSQTTSAFKLSRKFPAKFTYTTKKNGWLVHYYSDLPGCVALSEVWLKKITDFYEESAPCWSLITPYQGDSVFFMLVRDGVVRESIVLPVGDLDEVDLACSDTIYMTEPSEVNVAYAQVRKRLNEIGLNDRVCSIHPLNDNEYLGFELNAKRSYKMATIFTSLAVLLIALLLIWSPTKQDAKQTQEEQVIDEYLGYRSQMKTTLPAFEAINSAFRMASYGVLLPKGWSLNQITLNGHQVIATVMREKEGLYSVAQTWLEMHSDLKPFATLYPDRLLITQSISTTLNHWENQIPTYGSIQPLIDKLVVQSWGVDSFKESKSATFTALEMTVRKEDVYVNELQSLVNTFSELPIGINSIAIAPDGIATYRVEMNLKYIGENQ
ncbi:hypothetical protein [Vibrio sp. L85]|uniref:hypothetical protein n=1 Tax=Vibrio sp. L85 TaxID=1769292 RepID=UPI0009A2C968|nr:hypothetical protein [Vibrio sp. L85]